MACTSWGQISLCCKYLTTSLFHVLPQRNLAFFLNQKPSKTEQSWSQSSRGQAAFGLCRWQGLDGSTEPLKSPFFSTGVKQSSCREAAGFSSSHSTKKANTIRGATGYDPTLSNVYKNTRERQDQLENQSKHWKTWGFVKKTNIMTPLKAKLT